MPQRFTPEENRSKVGPEAANWTDLERNVLRATEELLRTAHVADGTWNGLAAELNTQQLIKLLFVIGNYGMLSWIINAFGIQPETDDAAIEAMAENANERIKT